MNRCLLGIEAGKENTDGAEPLIARIRNVGQALSPVQSADDLAQLAIAVAQPPAPIPPAGTPEPASTPRSVKVDTGKLDALVDMVGELVIAQSMIRHDPDMAGLHNSRLTRNLAQLTRITSDVQRVAMAMRMHPVSQLFQRMARLVRDLSKKSGKQVHLELSGEDTELDRNMVEELADPLMHMVRNAVDHGAEPPEDRIAAGKDATARLELKAWHQGGFINIGISDDGRGLVREKILKKARERGLTAGGDGLSDQEVFSFIFEPGFSTAEQVTDVSGRGVGMDVARRQIVKLRGRIEIASTPGLGTTFTLKLPLTLAIIEGLVTGVGDQRYIIPIFAVKEMFRPAPESLSSVPDGGEMVLVRGSLLPILRLHSRFSLDARSEDPAGGVLVVVESTQRNYCILVDELIGKQEVVIKSLGETFRNVPGIAGGSILGDGRVGLILDVEALFGSPSH
jgi:two-component system chemotaxis sensor kinase CheA